MNMKISRFLTACLLYTGSHMVVAQSYSQQIEQAEQLLENKDFLHAAIAYSNANRSVSEPIPEEVYNTACAWSRAGKPDSAFKYLSAIVGRSDNAGNPCWTV
jgi:hypothetical protein